MDYILEEHKDELDEDFIKRLVAVAGTRHRAAGVACDFRQMPYDEFRAVAVAEKAIVKHISENVILFRHSRFNDWERWELDRDDMQITLEATLRKAYVAGGIPEERAELNTRAFASLAFDCKPFAEAEVIPFSR